MAKFGCGEVGGQLCVLHSRKANRLRELYDNRGRSGLCVCVCCQPRRAYTRGRGKGERNLRPS